MFSFALITSCSLFEEDKGNYLTGKINYLGNSSAKDGNWEITDLTKVEYVVVYNKEHAFDFQYGVTVGSGETEAGSQSLDTAWVFLDGFVIDNDLTFRQNSNIYSRKC